MKNAMLLICTILISTQSFAANTPPNVLLAANTNVVIAAIHVASLDEIYKKAKNWEEPKMKSQGEVLMAIATLYGLSAKGPALALAIKEMGLKSSASTKVLAEKSSVATKAFIDSSINLLRQNVGKSMISLFVVGASMYSYRWYKPYLKLAKDAANKELSLEAKQDQEASALAAAIQQIYSIDKTNPSLSIDENEKAFIKEGIVNEIAQAYENNSNPDIEGVVANSGAVSQETINNVHYILAQASQMNASNSASTDLLASAQQLLNESKKNTSKTENQKDAEQTLERTVTVLKALEG